MQEIATDFNRNIGYAMKSLKSKVLLPDHSEGLWISRDCLLIETSTEKGYTYRAFNYITGEDHYLGNKRTAITQAHYPLILERMRTLPFYNVEIPTKGTDLIEYIFRHVFVNYGYMIRNEQVELSKSMYEALSQGELLLSDIPVGLGKTHAYLVAAIVYHLLKRSKSSEIISNKRHMAFLEQKARPVIISTSSIELQKAIEKEYIPEISRMLLENGIIDKPVSCVIRKGKENYLCDKRLQSYVATLDPKKKSGVELDTLYKLQRSFRIDLGEVTGISKYDKRKIMVNSELCFTCKAFKSCKYQLFMERAMDSEINFQICNHNYFFADLIRRKKNLKALLPNYDAVIIDEAHKLVPAATDMYSVSFNQKEFNTMIRKVLPSSDKSAINKFINVSCQEVLRLSEVISIQLRNLVPVEYLNEPIEKYAICLSLEVKKELKKMVLNLRHLSELLPINKGHHIAGIKRVIEVLQRVLTEDMISWIEYPEGQQFIELHAVQKKVEDQIRTDLFDMNIPIILTSGTIAVEGNFDYFVKSIGLNEKKRATKFLSMASPFDYVNKSLMYFSKDIPFPDTDDDFYIQAVAKEVEKLIRASYGHALVLFTSYMPMMKVFQLLNESTFDFPIFQLLKGNSSTINKYRDSHKGVLLACGAVWEGIDFPGDLLSHLIIVKLPFLIPDPVTDYQKSRYEQFLDFQEEILIPQMLIRLKQGHGRAIRTETDTAVISILDCRAKEGGRYHENVLHALPTCQVTQHIEDISQFIVKKKSKSYFN